MPMVVLNYKQIQFRRTVEILVPLVVVHNQFRPNVVIQEQEAMCIFLLSYTLMFETVLELVCNLLMLFISSMPIKFNYVKLNAVF